MLILNGQQQSFVCQPQQQQHHAQQQNHHQQHLQQRRIKEERLSIHQPSHIMAPNAIIPKQEAMDSSSSSSDKQMSYNSMSYSSTQHSTSIDSPQKEHKDFHDSLQFFNETLDLSQEDIQKTLSANMPIGSGHHNHQSVEEDPIGTEINPMDFIDNCDVVGVESAHGHEDDFVNLDAFDMLVEFPELEFDGLKNGYLQHASGVHSASEAQTETHIKKSSSDTAVNVTANEVFNITDYSPEWAYPEGGVKVLVTGPWNINSNYTVLFDSFPVPTTIVQSGVLRCYCPGI